MLRFIQFLNENLLVENRLDFIKQKNPTINISHDTTAQHKDAGAIIDHFAEKADPTPNKAHTQWIVNRYKQGDFRQEDHPRVKEALSNFNRYKPKLNRKDINQYKSLSDVENAVAPHLGLAASGKEEKKQQKETGAELIHNGPNLTVRHIKTKEAACQYGRGTKWCTTSKNDNQFDTYNKKGPVYIIQNKHTGEKRQFQFQGDEFKDEKDEDISLSGYIKKNPELKDVKRFRDSSHGFYFAKTPEEADQKLAASSSKVRATVARDPNTPPHYLDQLMADKHLHHRIAENPSTPPRLLDQLVNNPDKLVRSGVAGNPSAQPRHLERLMNDPDDLVRYTVAKNPSTPSYHLDRLTTSTDTNMRKAVASNLGAQPHHLDHLMKDPDTSVRAAVASNPKSQSYHLDHLVKDHASDVRDAVGENPNAHPHHLDHLMKDDRSYVRAAVASNPSALPHHLDHLMKDEDPEVRYCVAQNPNVQLHHLDHLMNDEDEEVRDGVARSARALQHHINNIG